MPVIVGVHGIAQQVKGPEVLSAAWLPALRDGLALAGAKRIGDAEFGCAFYGDLFRKKGTRALAPPPLTAADVASDQERELVALWWQEAARVDAQVTPPGAKTRARTPMVVQRALNNLLKAKFFAGLSERALIWDLKQVTSYLHDPSMRVKIRARVDALIGPETRVVVAHSLGSVVAYEVLAARPRSMVRTLVTLGSPLGIPRLVFDRLQPPPVAQRGVWPRVERWFNIADAGDIVALEKKLSTRFGPDVTDILVDNESQAHDVERYLTARETGGAIASGLA
jgi:hypothetical protein